MEAGANSEKISKTFKDLSVLEEEFLKVEVESTRRKEHDLKPLYNKRQQLLDTLEGFWPVVFQNAPDDLAEFFTPLDLEILSTLKSFNVERYQIKSQTQGEPRSVRFTFEFSPNEYLEDKVLVKEVEYRSGPGVSEGFVSVPVPIKWKNKKADPTRGLLAGAVELYQAEQALNSGGGEVDPVERESLWQHEKLHTLLIKEDESDEDLSFFCWFGFRGAILKPSEVVEEGDEEDSDDEPETMLDVEIFPPGEELTISLAEDLWPTAPVNFTEALMESGDDDDDDSDEEMADGDGESDDETPDLVPAHEVERPSKKRRMGRPSDSSKTR